MNKSLSAALIIAIACFLTFVLLVPEYNGISEARQTLKARQAIADERTLAQLRVKDLDANYRQHEVDIQKILVALPEGKHSDQVVSSIQAAAVQSGVQLTSLSIVNSPDSAGSYKTSLIQLTSSGTYAGFINFLKNLEQNLRLSDLIEFSLAQQAGSATGGVLSMNVKLRTYNLK